MTSSVAINEKQQQKQNVRQIIQLSITGSQGGFSGKITPNIDGFTDKAIVQCDV